MEGLAFLRARRRFTKNTISRLARYFTRPQGLAIVDWVLQGYWGLTRSPVPR